MRLIASEGIFKDSLRNRQAKSRLFLIFSKTSEFLIVEIFSTNRKTYNLGIASFLDEMAQEKLHIIKSPDLALLNECSHKLQKRQLPHAIFRDLKDKKEWFSY